MAKHAQAAVWAGVGALALAVATGSAADAPARQLTPAAANAHIAAAGKAEPDWFVQVPLRVPPTLDLTWRQNPGGWQPERNFGAHMWSVVQPNPDKWRYGIRLLHHALEVNAQNPSALRQTQQALGRLYLRGEQDYARAAYWLQKAGGEEVALAECAWRLGSKALAVQFLERRGIPSRETIRVYASMGDHARAGQMAAQLAQRQPVDGFMAAAETSRSAGRYEASAAYYGKAWSAAQPMSGKRKLADAARDGREAMAALAGIPAGPPRDGERRGKGAGYRGSVEVAVAVKGGRIGDVRVVSQREDGYFFHIANRVIPPLVVSRGDLRGVDAVTGATITSDAIVNAVARALVRPGP